MQKDFSFDKMARFINIRIKALRETASLLIAWVLFFVPLSVPLCPEAVFSQDICSCCCCRDSGLPLSKTDVERNECSCHKGQKQSEENSPAIVLPHFDSRPKGFLLAKVAGDMAEDHQSQLVGLHPHFFLLPSRDRPLYLLNSILII
jgi:hypothetical protein